MFRRRQAEPNRRSVQEPISKEENKRGKRRDRRISQFERRQKYMDRRQVYDGFWIGARDRRRRIMDRRRRDSMES